MPIATETTKSSRPAAIPMATTTLVRTAPIAAQRHCNFERSKSSDARRSERHRDARRSERHRDARPPDAEPSFKLGRLGLSFTQ